MRHLQRLSNNPYSQHINPNSHIYTHFLIRFNIVLPSRPIPSQKSLFLRFTSENFEIIPIFSLPGYMPCPS
jgi:hypothetical protein